MTMERGTQIAYIPNHVLSEINAIKAKRPADLAEIAILLERSPDIEFGFITSQALPVSEDGMPVCFCRFWRKGQPGILRTVANSERCDAANLVEHKSVPVERVAQVLADIERSEAANA